MRATTGLCGAHEAHIFQAETVQQKKKPACRRTTTSWQEFGALDQDANFVRLQPVVRKPLEEVAAKKRAMYRRRYGVAGRAGAGDPPAVCPQLGVQCLDATGPAGSPCSFCHQGRISAAAGGDGLSHRGRRTGGCRLHAAPPPFTRVEMKEFSSAGVGRRSPGGHQATVHVGELELVFEVGDGAQTADQHVGLLPWQNPPAGRRSPPP